MAASSNVNCSSSTNGQTDFNCYQLLTPLPNTDYSSSITGVNTTSPLPYITTLAEILISLGVVIAVFFIVYGGIIKMTTDNIEQKKEGNNIIYRTIIGLLLLAFSYILISTINPNLLTNPFILINSQAPTPTATTVSNEQSSRPSRVVEKTSGSQPQLTNTTANQYYFSYLEPVTSAMKYVGPYPTVDACNADRAKLNGVQSLSACGSITDISGGTFLAKKPTGPSGSWYWIDYNASNQPNGYDGVFSTSKDCETARSAQLAKYPGSLMSNSCVQIP